MTRSQVQAEIDLLGVEPLAPGLVAVALDLAAAIDESDAPTAKAVAAREVRAIMLELRRLAPVKSEGDALDGILGERDDRRARLRSV